MTHDLAEPQANAGLTTGAVNSGTYCLGGTLFICVLCPLGYEDYSQPLDSMLEPRQHLEVLGCCPEAR